MRSFSRMTATATAIQGSGVEHPTQKESQVKKDLDYEAEAKESKEVTVAAHARHWDEWDGYVDNDPVHLASSACDYADADNDNYDYDSSTKQHGETLAASNEHEMNAQPVDDQEKYVEQEPQPQWQSGRWQRWQGWQWRQWQWQQWRDADAADDADDYDSNAVKSYTSYTWSCKGLPKKSVPVHPEEHSQLPPLPPPAHPPPPPPPPLQQPADSATSSRPTKSTEECIAELERRERLKQMQKVGKETETVEAAVSNDDASETEAEGGDETDIESEVPAQDGKTKQKKPRKKRKRAGQHVQYYNRVYGKPWSAGYKQSRLPR